jgi:chromosome segregation ATPase
MKEYYNDITRENIELIKVHKDKLKEIKATIAGNDFIVADLKKKEKDLKVPLMEAQAERDSLKKSTLTFDKDKMALTNAKGCLKDFKKSLKTIRDNKEKLDSDYKKLEKEKNDMYNKFEIAIG